MDQSPSWEANRTSASQEIPLISRNPKVHYRIPNSPPPVILSQLDSVHIPTTHFLKIHLNILSFYLRLGLPSGLFPSDFPTKTLYTPLLSPHTNSSLTKDAFCWFILNENIQWFAKCSLTQEVCASHHHNKGKPSSPDNIKVTVHSAQLQVNIPFTTLGFASNILTWRDAMSSTDIISHTST